MELPDNDDVVVGAAGQAEINISAGEQAKTVKVTVVDSPIASLRIEPPLAAVAVGQPICRCEVVAKTKSGVELQVAADRLVWSAVPRAEVCQVRLRQAATARRRRHAQAEQLVARLGTRRDWPRPWSACTRRRRPKEPVAGNAAVRPSGQRS